MQFCHNIFWIKKSCYSGVEFIKKDFQKWCKKEFLRETFCIQVQAYKSQLSSCEKLLKNIQKTDHSIAEKTHETEKKLSEEADEWSQEWLEYLFDNKIWFPVFVRSEFLT